MAAIVWPREALPVRHPSVDPAYRNLSGPAAADGLGQVVASDAGKWKAVFAEVIVHQQGDEDRIKLWHAINGLLEGRIGSVIIPVPVTGRRPLPAGVTDDDIDFDPGVPHEDGAYFDDGIGYETAWISVEISAAAARRATTLSVTKTVAGDLEPGMRFSIDPGAGAPVRLYQIRRVTAQASGSATLTIWPPLRESVASGQHLEFARPVVQMRLATDNQMDLTPEYNRWAFPTVSFIEDLGTGI